MATHRHLEPEAARVLARHFPNLKLDGVKLLDSGRRRERWLLRLAGASAITLGHRIVARPGALDPWDPRGLALAAHELTHVRQFESLGAGRFLLRYFGEYLCGRILGKSHRAAYLAISFEREAHAVQHEVQRALTAAATPLRC